MFAKDYFTLYYTYRLESFSTKTAFRKRVLEIYQKEARIAGFQLDKDGQLIQISLLDAAKETTNLFYRWSEKNKNKMNWRSLAVLNSRLEIKPEQAVDQGRVLQAQPVAVEAKPVEAQPVQAQPVAVEAKPVDEDVPPVGAQPEVRSEAQSMEAQPEIRSELPSEAQSVQTRKSKRTKHKAPSSTKRKSKRQRKAIVVQYHTRSKTRKLREADDTERDSLESRMQPLVRSRDSYYHQSRMLVPSPDLDRFKKQCRQFLARMIKEPLDSPCGFPVVLEMPNSNYPLINILRHAPIRILFGCEKSINGNYALRYAYSSGSGKGTVGTDPRTFQIRLLEDELKEAAVLIKEILQEQNFPDMSILDFNSAEMKIYMGKAIKAAGGANLKAFQNDKLGFHCDQIYSKKGEFLVHMNSQEQWTPVVIASFGATRKLTFKLVDVNDKKKNKTAIANFVVEMKDGDVFLLCPADEYPTKYITRSICKWTHGVDALEKDDDFSVAMMFRVATNTVQVNRSSNKKILTTDDKESLESVINTTQKAGWKKRSTHFDQNDQQLTKFMMYEACKVHEKIQECSAKIIQKLES